MNEHLDQTNHAEIKQEFNYSENQSEKLTQNTEKAFKSEKDQQFCYGYQNNFISNIKVFNEVYLDYDDGLRTRLEKKLEQIDKVLNQDQIMLSFYDKCDIIKLAIKFNK